MSGQRLQLGPGETVLRERDEAELEIVMDRRLSREAAKQARLMRTTIPRWLVLSPGEKIQPELGGLK